MNLLTDIDSVAIDLLYGQNMKNNYNFGNKFPQNIL